MLKQSAEKINIGGPMSNKLELTWVGKEEKLAIEPRLLIENPELSNTANDPETENMIIHGDNLLALKALESKYAGKVKCIYIDPPYNTGSAFEHYDDNLEHSTWLSLMKPRLEILRNLLSDDGYIFIQIDDNEQAYLTVLMDEIFGRYNHINTICINMNSLSGVKMTHVIRGKRFPAQKEYILLYRKGDSARPLKIEKKPKETWDKEYNLIIPELSHEDFESFMTLDESIVNDKLKNMRLISLVEYSKELGIEFDEEWKWENSYRIFGSKSNRSLANRTKNSVFEQTIFCYTNNDGNNRFFRTDFNRNVKDPRIELVQAEMNSMVFISDNWTDISNDGGVGQEGGVGFPKSKKPEKIIKRILECATSEHDLVLDSFLGSGTTAAVAHKMNRRYIGIEMGDHAYTHCKVRLDKVIDGSDQGGISKAVNWQGGGAYKFYELAPTLINKDDFDEPIINSEYDKEMLASAVALHEGFTYSPNEENFWKQSKGSENSYLFVTTKHITRGFLDAIKMSMNESEYLIIACKSFDGGLDKVYSEITIKKIPQMLLDRCEFGKDNYNLNIVNPPVYEEDHEDEES